MKTFKESKEIKKAIDEAEKIILCLHISPDADSIGSNLALYHYLKTLNKEILILSADTIPSYLSFLPGSDLIKTEDPATLDPNSYDLFLSLDSADLLRITRHESVQNIENQKQL